jgi:AcrR family transcriptional regulator
MTRANHPARRQKAGRRPAEAGSDVRKNLLRAARELFTEQGYDATTTKQIAQRANANSAMIHYYFGDKAGLHGAMLADAMAPILQGLDRLAASPAELAPEDFIDLYMRTLSARPWLPRLLIREVLPENGRLREVFFAQVADRVAAAIPALIRRSQGSGVMRGELDPMLVAISLASLAIFPFLAGDVLRPVLGIDYGGDFIDRLIAHSRDVFLHGTAGGPQP